MRAILLFNHLFLILAMIGSSGSADRVPARPNEAAVFSMKALTISLHAATQATILFKSQNGVEVSAPNKEAREIPYLVLNRNGVPTPSFERTLHLSLGQLQVPPEGLYISLEIDTQHSDPDLDQEDPGPIRVWQERRFLPFSPQAAGPRTVDFRVVFQQILQNSTTAVRTPTDYYSYRVSLWDRQGKVLHTIEQPFAFLLENQWRIPLPSVREDVLGAAPNELVVYFYDMIPFQSDRKDPESRIPRREIERYIQTELVPTMVQAFEEQTNLWDLPWYEEWSNPRAEEAPKTLSVALNEYGTCYHGAAPSLGHAMISIRVDGSFVEYDSITDGLLSVFRHELFHNQQRNISLHYGARGNISGQEGAWELFSEGTAVLASLVGQPTVQMQYSSLPRSYLKRANGFLGLDGVFEGGLNQSYRDIPYHTALYWRFLYEQCGGIRDGVEDPAAGMQIIIHVLETLYSGSIADINSSTAAIPALPGILYVALYKTPACPFHSYDESLVHFARAIYLLRREDGRGPAAAGSGVCGFYDPDQLYSVPDAERHTIQNDGRTTINGSIRSSFGLDLLELRVNASRDRQPLKIIFRDTSGPAYEYNIELWTKLAPGSRNGKTGEPIFSKRTHLGGLIIELEPLDLEEVQSLDLVITRTDVYEDASLPGQYVIQVISETGIE